jgi:hypothetical protein
MDLPAVKIEHAMKGLDLRIVRSWGFPARARAENETKWPRFHELDDWYRNGVPWDKIPKLPPQPNSVFAPS